MEYQKVYDEMRPQMPVSWPDDALTNWSFEREKCSKVLLVPFYLLTFVGTYRFYDNTYFR